MARAPAHTNGKLRGRASETPSPHNRDAERGVLGGILRDPDTLPSVQQIIVAESFYFDAHQKIFAAVVQLASERTTATAEPIDLVSLQDLLRKRKQLEDVGGSEYLVELWEAVPTGANAEYHAKLVRDAAMIRGLIHTVNEVLRDAHSPTGSAADLIDLAERRLRELRERTEAGERRAVFASRSLAEIESREIRWLWPGRIPYGALSIIDGDPSKGKSLITIDIAARLSCGSVMPFAEAEGDPGNALIIAAEDAAEEVIKPRAEAAGADLRRVRVAETIRVGNKERPIRFPDDFHLLEKEVRDTNARLVIIDPLLGFLSQAIDSHKDQSIREVLHELKLVAERTGAAFLGLRHLGKAGSGSALYRGLGSIGITAAARSAMTVDAHPNDPDLRVLATTKVNLAKPPRSLTYRVVEEYGRPVIRWGEECDITADDLGARPFGSASGAREDAKEFLCELLARNPVRGTEVEAQAKGRGISKATLRRASAALGVEVYREGFGKSGGWFWRLPAKGAHPSEPPKDAHDAADGEHL